MWHKNLDRKSKRLHNIIWHSFDVPWFWEQAKYEIKLLLYYSKNN